ncbi:MAG TPA: hypothetical protein PK152_06335 [Anaerolineales bacterium]|nr:hypothetical protein [Anaerolineales bacterium]
MLIHHSPFERVTAITDVFMGLLAAFAALNISQLAGFRSDLWAWTFGLLAVSSFLGAVAHGFQMSQRTNDRLWMPINLSLGLTLGLFVVASLFDLGGEQLARVALPIMLAVGVGFFLFTLWKPGTFMTFLAYEALAMIFALGAYGYVFFNDSLAGAGWLAVGIFVTILAALVQATGKAGKGIVWYFDNNGVFHVVQMLGLVLLWLGLVA